MKHTSTSGNGKSDYNASRTCASSHLHIVSKPKPAAFVFVVNLLSNHRPIQRIQSYMSTNHLAYAKIHFAEGRRPRRSPQVEITPHQRCGVTLESIANYTTASLNKSHLMTKSELLSSWTHDAVLNASFADAHRGKRSLHWKFVATVTRKSSGPGPCFTCHMRSTCIKRSNSL